jgi:outer membrane protein TolC
MRARNWPALVLVGLALVSLGGLSSAAPPDATPAAPATMRLTLDEAKQRALSNSKVLALATMNAQSKDYATRATRADYFPKVIGSVVYFNFDSPLGTVITTQGRPRLGIPSTTIAANVLNQNSSLSTLSVAQPITALLKVRQGVQIARADEQIAHAQREKATRAIANGAEQLYWGLLAARRIQGGAQLAVKGAEGAAKSNALEARTALVEARQGLQAADDQVTDVEGQLNSLLDLPLCTKLELVEPVLPVLPVHCADEAISAAIASSPEVAEAEQNVAKARAAVKAAKVDYLPNVNVIGGYANQTAADYIQPNIGYVGVQGSYTFFEWGKRKNTIREREMMVAMALAKVSQTQDEVRDNAQKEFREVEQANAALKNATDLLELRKEAVKTASTPTAALAAAKAQMLAEIDLVKADLTYRLAIANLGSLVGK